MYLLIFIRQTNYENFINPVHNLLSPPTDKPINQCTHSSAKLIITIIICFVKEQNWGRLLCILRPTGIVVWIMHAISINRLLCGCTHVMATVNARVLLQFAKYVACRVQYRRMLCCDYSLLFVLATRNMRQSHSLVGYTCA